VSSLPRVRTPAVDISRLSSAERLGLLERLQASLAPTDVPRAAARRAPEPADEALRASELRYRRLFESAKDGILILDAETGMIVDVNPFLTELLGYSHAEICDKHVWDLGFLRDIVANQDNFRELSQQEYIRYDDRALETRAGRRIEVEFVSNAYPVDGRRVIQCNIRDMTEAARAKAALEASEHLTQVIINALPVRVFWKDRNLVFLGCNAVLARDAGLADPREIVGKNDHQMAWHDQATSYRKDDLQVIESGQPKLLIEEQLTTAEGNTITLLTSKVPLRDATGAISGILGTYQDITPLKRAEASADRLAMAVQQAAESIVITDANGTIQDVNPAFEKTSGYSREEAVGQNPRMLKSGKQDAGFYQRMWTALTDGQVWHGRLTNKRKDGTLYDEEVTISPMRNAAGKTVSFVAVKRDVTEQERLESQLRRAQRMESVGTLAGGIAHDLNNALAPILMAAELLRLALPDCAMDDLDLIEDGARRGADLVKQLLTFARGAEGDRLPIKLRPLLTEMERMIRGTFPKNIELRVDCPRGLPAILGDTTQLHQVLLNLLLNARDAMPDGGTLSVDVQRKDVDASVETEALKVVPGPYVVLRVTDTGTGIPPELVDRIFDPFFTTKGPDKGTGLGLATTLGIVKGHAGFIRVYSAPGHGTTFRVYLPVHDGGATETALVPTTESAFQGNGETILVVDDEPSVRNILRKVLTRMNFKVRTASDGTSALHEVSEHGAELSAVITDLHMPHLDGMSFVRVLRSRFPDAAVIVVSGLIDEQAREQFASLGVRAILDKPFAHADLVTALQTISVH
jgi:PAS domain S-box-containing protein